MYLEVTNIELAACHSYVRGLPHVVSTVKPSRILYEAEVRPETVLPAQQLPLLTDHKHGGRH